MSFEPMKSLTFPSDSIRSHSSTGCFFSAVLMVMLLSAGAGAAELNLDEQQLSHKRIGKTTISVPEGYELEILDAKVRGGRMIEFGPNGNMFIGSFRNVVFRLQPPYTTAQRYLTIDDYPHSVAIREDEIFIATTSALFKAPYDANADRLHRNQLELVVKLPGGFGHSSRTVRVGPDQKVYVSIGSSGNCSDQMISNDYPFEDRRGGVFVIDESSPEASLVPFASGLRNPVGFDWHPQTKKMYASNNGPDHLGFDSPPEYFSELTKDSFHGMPWYQYDGNQLKKDPCITSNPPYAAEAVKKPAATFPARNAPLGVAFVPSEVADKRFANNALVALHGSWATEPDGLFTGPKSSRREPGVVMVQFTDGKATGAVVPVVTGFQSDNGDRWARPAGVGVGPDENIYITSDDGDFEGLMRLRKLN